MTEKPRANEILNRFFILKKAKRSSYSRAKLARELQLSTPFVSRILSGKKPLPPEHFGSICRALEIDQIGQKQLKLALSRFNEELLSSETRSAVKNSLSIQESSMKDSFLLEEWYHLAILNLVTLKDFEPNPDWMSQRLNIPPKTAASTWKNLVGLGIVFENEGCWKKRSNLARFTTTDNFKIKQKYYIQHLERAKAVLKTQQTKADFERRLINGMTVATNSKNVEKAKSFLEETISNLLNILSEGEADRIYQFSLQLIPISTIDKSIDGTKG